MRRILLVLSVVVAVTFLGFITYKGGYDYLERKIYSVAGVFLDGFVERPPKAWLHRVNSPEKVEELQSRYNGLELDIVFHDDEKKFENSHDAVSLDNYPLEATLAKVNTNQVHGLWFDFKNLTPSNCLDSLRELSRLVSVVNLKPSQTIVESSDWVSLKAFHEAGFRTSFYLPEYTPKQLLPGGFAEKQIGEAVDSGNVDYVSFNARYYSDIQKFCDGKKFKMLVWVIPERWSYPVLAKKPRTMIDDPRVDVVLVVQRGKHHR